MKIPRTITVKGIKLTLKEAFEKYGISKRTYYRRLRNGFSIERAFLSPLPKPYLVEGKTLLEISKSNGINIKTLRQRLIRWEGDGTAIELLNRAVQKRGKK